MSGDDCGCDDVPQADCGPCGTGRRGKVWRVLAGSLFSHLLRVKRKKTGGSFDLTGYGARCYFRKNRYNFDEPPYATLTCEVVDATKGQVRVKLGATETRRLVDVGYFDVEVYKLDDFDVAYRVLQGEYVVDLEVTTA